MKEKKRILIVEDESINALSIQMALENKGYDICKIVSTGEDAIIIANKDNPDVVIMDINLAGPMNGLKAAGIIKTKHDIPIIFLTGYSDKDITNKAESFEKSICVKKPISPELIHFEIQKFFNKS